MTPADNAKVLDAAATELRSAYTLAADPQCDPSTAAPHLRRAWRALAYLSTGAVPVSEDEASANTDPALSAWLSPAHLGLIPERARANALAGLRAALSTADQPDPWSPASPAKPATDSALSDRALLAHVRTLNKLVAAIREEQLGRPLKSQAVLRWALRGAVALAAVTAFVLVALRPWQREDIGPWRGAYYPSKKFEGVPDIRRHVDVAFDWKLEPPTQSVPSDYFTARFDSCLVLDEDSEIAFMLVSDDGSRLFIDGKRVINNWKKKIGQRTKGARVELGPGVHHLRVEYFERTHKAALHLTASFDEANSPAPIPAQMLEFPGMEFDEDDPCAGAS